MKLSVRVSLISGLILAAGAAYYHFYVAEPTAAAGQANATAKPAAPGQGGPRRMGGPGGNMWNQPIPVKTVPAQQGDLKLQLKTIGTAVAQNTVLVQSRVSGPLLALHFVEGQQVSQGQLLAEIDPAPYQVKLAQAEGQLQQNMAQLQNAESDLALYGALKEQNSISRQQYNAQQSLVNQLKGSIKSNQAQVAAAKLELSWTKITAPISGRTGLRKVDVGNLVQANNADGLVSITQSAPLYVSFAIPENQLAAVRQAMQQNSAGLVVEAWDRAEQQLLSQGVLTTLDNQIDLATGTIRLRATFTNERDTLYPNQFVNVRLNVAEKTDAVTVVQDAVQYSADGPFVYVIEANKAQKRPLTLGIADNGAIEVLSGLKGGEAVVLEGLDRLRPGREVLVLGAERTPNSQGQEQAGARKGPRPAQQG